MLIAKHGILLKKHQYEQLRLIVKILIYYRDLVNQIIDKKFKQDSYDWSVKYKYYFTKGEKENDLKVKVRIFLTIQDFKLIKTFLFKLKFIKFKSLDASLLYGFDYIGSTSIDNLLLQSPKMEFSFSQLLKTISNKSYPLIHGENVFNLL